MNEPGGRLAFGSQGELVVRLRQKEPHEAQAQCCPILALQNETTAWMLGVSEERKQISFQLHCLPKGKLDVEVHL